MTPDPVMAAWAAGLIAGCVAFAGHRQLASTVRGKVAMQMAGALTEHILLLGGATVTVFLILGFFVLPAWVAGLGIVLGVFVTAAARVAFRLPGDSERTLRTSALCAAAAVLCLVVAVALIVLR